jgi:hypothetical protein
MNGSDKHSFSIDYFLSSTTARDSNPLRWDGPGNPLLMERFGTVDLHIKTGCFVEKQTTVSV